jgi:hypothetical protein
VLDATVIAFCVYAQPPSTLMALISPCRFSADPSLTVMNTAAIAKNKTLVRLGLNAPASPHPELPCPRLSAPKKQVRPESVHFLLLDSRAKCDMVA